MTKQKQHVKLYHLYYLCDYMNENKEFKKRKNTHTKKKQQQKNQEKTPQKTNKQITHTHAHT